MKKDMVQYKKNEAHTGVLKKLYVVCEENRRLKMENLRLRSELSTVYSVGNFSH